MVDQSDARTPRWPRVLLYVGLALVALIAALDLRSSSSPAPPLGGTFSRLSLGLAVVSGSLMALTARRSRILSIAFLVAQYRLAGISIFHLVRLTPRPAGWGH